MVRAKVIIEIEDESIDNDDAISITCSRVALMEGEAMRRAVDAAVAQVGAAVGARSTSASNGPREKRVPVED